LTGILGRFAVSGSTLWQEKAACVWCDTRYIINRRNVRFFDSGKLHCFTGGAHGIKLCGSFTGWGNLMKKEKKGEGDGKKNS
jgi:hypothetical protein